MKGCFVRNGLRGPGLYDQRSEYLLNLPLFDCVKETAKATQKPLTMAKTTRNVVRSIATCFVAYYYEIKQKYLICLQKRNQKATASLLKP